MYTCNHNNTIIHAWYDLQPNVMISVFIPPLTIPVLYTIYIDLILNLTISKKLYLMDF